MTDIILGALLAASLVSPVDVPSVDPHQEAWTIHLEHQDSLAPLRQLEVVLIRDDGSGSHWGVAVGQDVVLVPLSEGEGARLGCRGEGLWCPELDLPEHPPAPGSDEPVTLPVFTAAEYFGRLEAPISHLPPRLWLQGRLREPGGDAEPLAFEIEAAVEKGVFRFTGPRVPFDLRVAASGWTPVYRWDVQADGARHDLGDLPLVTGSSLCGFVHDQVSGLPASDAQVTLALPVSTGMATTAAVDGRSRLQGQAARTNSRGFFQLRDLAAGVYRLSIEDAQGRRQPTVVEAVEVLEDSEACLSDLELRTSYQVSIQISPSTAPDGTPWQVEWIWKADLGRSRHATAGEDGVARLRDVYHGLHQVLITAGEGRRAAFEEILVEQDGQEVHLDLDLVTLEGTIHLGDEPLPAQLRIAGGHGDEVHLASDDEGRFAGWLRRPAADFLSVQVDAETPPLHRTLPLRELGLGPEQDRLVLDLHLADLDLGGSVVDAATGLPVNGAELVAETQGGERVRATTDEEGRFRLLGLDHGQYRVTASHRTVGAAETLVVNLDDSTSPPAPTFLLHRWRPLEGRLLSSQGAGVGGAELTLQPVGEIAQPAFTRSDPTGRFEARLPQEARRAVVHVQAPNQLLWSACLDLPAEGPLEVRLPPLPGGTLSWASTFEPGIVRHDRSVLLTRQGGFLAHDRLYNWSRQSLGPAGYQSPATGEGILTVPRLAADNYALIETTLPDDALATLTCQGSFSADVEWQVLSAGGELLLEQDLRPRQAAR